MARRTLIEGLRAPGVGAALAAAVLFGAGTPLSKPLLDSVEPQLLAGLLYAGAGMALGVARLRRPEQRARLTKSQWANLGAAIGIGGVAAPVLLMLGLARVSAASASLLLNAEGVFTALVAWFVFRENVDRRIALGMAMIAAGAVALSFGGQLQHETAFGYLLVLGACLCWAIDNNLTRKVALLDATWIAFVKASVAGAVNLGGAFLLGSSWPPWKDVGAAFGIGSLAYGASLALFVTALKHLGSARTTAYYSVAPFAGAVVALAWLGEPLTLQLVLAAVLMGIGVWLHLTERHEHLHRHDFIEHEHEHVHDEHHRHEHGVAVAPGVRHTHRHRHEPVVHSHHHFPDAHHQHEHGD